MTSRKQFHRPVLPIIVFGLLFVAGFFVRTYLASNSIDKLYYDAAEYSSMAKDILQTGLTANCCTHGAGYPLYLAAIYKAFGNDNLQAVRLVQVVTDLGTAFFVFLTAKSLLGKSLAFLAFIIYILNPFTSAYTGLVLSEIWALFLVAVIAYVISIREFYKRKRLIFFLGLLFGFFVITKISFYFFVLTFMIVLPFIITARVRERIVFTVLLLLGLSLSFVYPLYANYQRFGLISVLPPYRTLGNLLYGNFIIGYYPEITSEFNLMSPKYAVMTSEYYFQYAGHPEKYKEYNSRYMKLFWGEMRAHWPDFLRNTVRNIFWVWDKRYLYTYTDPFFPRDTVPLRVGAFTAYILAFVGLFREFKKKGFAVLKKPVISFGILMAIYISVILGMVSTESRLSLPFYPILCIWVAYGFQFLIHSFKNRVL